MPAPTYLPRPALGKRLVLVETDDEGLVLIPFTFIVAGGVDPVVSAGRGDLVQAIQRSAAGKYLVTLKAKPARCFYGHASADDTADGVNRLGKVDWSTVVSAGTFVVRLMTAGAETDPADGTVIGGYLIVKKTTRTRAGL